MKVLGITGWSGSGKTTLLARLLPELIGRSLRISTIKHAHHAFDVDTPGKDSHVHRQAGAVEVMVSSGARWALMHELRDEPEADLDTLLSQMGPVDLVLVEGFKKDGHDKIEVLRQGGGREPIHPGNATVVAIASDRPLPDAGRPVLPLDDVVGIADFIVAHCRLGGGGE